MYTCITQCVLRVPLYIGLACLPNYPRLIFSLKSVFRDKIALVSFRFSFNPIYNMTLLFLMSQT